MAVRPEGFVAVLHDPFGNSNQRDFVAARWDHEPVSLLQFESAAFGVILHPSNGRLVFADQSGTVSCLQMVADDGKPVWSQPVGGATADDVRALTGEVWLDLEGPLAFAGESIACLGNRLLLLDADTGAVTRYLGKVPQSAHSLAASADGRWLAVLGFSELRVWDLTTDESRSLKLDAMDPSSPMAVGPDSLLILGQQGFQLVRLNSADLTIEAVDFDGWDYQNWRAA